MRPDAQATRERYADWLPRGIVSGFAATVGMALIFFLAYGFAQVASNIELSPRRGSATFTQWLEALTNNQVLDLASGSIYAAAVAHLVVGVLWAIIYAYAFEHRLPGTPLARGVTFSLIPWVLSLVVFLPLVGGGLLGLAIGAGPLPAAGNLILHLVYGATLGVVYGPMGDIPADFLEPDEPEVADHYERTAARGIIVGGVVGLAVGVAGAALQGGQPDARVLDVPALAFIPVTVALGATFGGFLGSFVGLTARPTDSA